MINLNDYENRTIEFKIGNKTVSVKEASNNLYEKMINYEAITDNKEAIKEQRKLVLEQLNRNKEGIKFTTKDIEELPQAAVIRVYQEVGMLTRKALENPN
ncbi:hypothetical protein [Clostridium taeniosporum]|uniref:Uncharacterized protein n=1 Tax=Clostridium taeniosporum TaxID=394958 RepID=A0A1D7XLU7_9CLOT|nr:hypothetical protein [Clostridium taeniosporum]AOR24301.1 hypothetical protein BGI42_11385 [Clostridium taeniosporum]